MALTTDDLFALELELRLDAHDLKKSWPKADIQNPEIGAGIRAMTEAKNKKAANYEAVANLVQGLRGSWAKIGPDLRAGFNKVGAAVRRAETREEAATTPAAGAAQ